MPRVVTQITVFLRCLCLLPACLSTLLLGGCSHQDGNDFVTQFRQAKPQEFLQTSVDRMATLAMRDNLDSLYLLMSKLYLRNPDELRKSGFLDVNTAVKQVRQAIEQQQPLPTLGGKKDLAALSYAMSPEFLGDRVGAFIYAIGSMLVTAHGNRLEFYMTDAINPTFVNNAARNIEKATWILSQRQNKEGQPLLFSNEISEEGSNLSFATEFGKVVARLDLLTQMLDERYRRIGLNYAQSLLFLNFLPVQ
ncbi:hypothetical protein N8H74_24925 [Pseudomonas sp. B2M1-30]|uniref:Lipoprotein n=1 Tax=Pseudomonas koreensis TaxID=198620 RepID=A0A9X2XML8_9PSED|nr:MULTISPECIES: hypothetical protein [Pseudomonas]MCU0121522.1 hypothetical protein [Pseudomonas sp. B2M1-30]MCU7251473.1 hypothetical protein [Pseudomonas koreensis]MCU7261250.1 hypothetical protein [Pseudomonas koreensis]